MGWYGETNRVRVEADLSLFPLKIGPTFFFSLIEFDISFWKKTSPIPRSISISEVFYVF